MKFKGYSKVIEKERVQFLLVLHSKYMHMCILNSFEI